MLVFIAALKSREVSESWERVLELFENSLYSVYNQTDPDFKVIVVCSEKPELKREYDDRVEFIEADLVPPAKEAYEGRNIDKYKKYSIAMIRAIELNPDFVMFFDADDLVSRRLSRYANSQKDCNGWMIKKGYRWNYGRRWMQYTDKFNCGTNCIVNVGKIMFPKDASNEEISKCIRLTHGHQTIEEDMRKQGDPLKELPFPGAIQVLGHGENTSDLKFGPDKAWKGWRFFLGSLARGSYRPITGKIKREFSIT